MKKKYFKSIVLGLATVALASCSDVADEITSIVYNRNFSPTSVEAKVRNRTNIELSWNLGDGVTNYNVEVYANDSLTFAGSPVKSFSVSPDEVPVLIKGLEGETQYSFRVQATDGNSSRDSKWSSAYAKTEAEQIFKNVAEEDIKGSSVTLRWPAGEKAATIVLTPGDIVYNVTDDDIAAGAATITGLTPETEYTAVMKRANGLTRGTITFTTGIDLAETDILVKTGESLYKAITDAPEGYRLIVEPGEYNLSEDATTPATFSVNKEVSIKGLRDGDKPIIKGVFELKDGSNLTIEQCVIDGTGTGTVPLFQFAEKSKSEGITVINCEIKNIEKAFYLADKSETTITAVIIDNCFIHDIKSSGSDFMDGRTVVPSTLTITNTTFWNCASACRNIVRDNKKDPMDVTFDHCTFVNVMTEANSDGKSYPFFNMQCKTGSIKFTNNLMYNSVNTETSSTNHKNTPTPTFDNNVYSEGCKFATWDESGKVLDPQFKDAANGDFTIGNDNVKDKKAGDPRWY